MKKLLVGLLVLGSISSFAHPDDRSPISNIGVDSKLIVLNDINIEPNVKAVSSKSGSCSIVMKSVFNKDRVLRAGSELIVEDTKLIDYVAETVTTNRYDVTHFYARKDILYVDNNEIESISCSKKFRTPYKYNLNSVTIIQFKNDFTGILKVELAEPVGI